MDIKKFLKKEKEIIEHEVEIVEEEFEEIDLKIIAWMKKHGLDYLRWSLGIVFIWFGALKPYGYSPAIELVKNTVYFVDPSWFVPFLGYWEVLIGICLIVKPLIRLGIFLMAVQMVGTFMPLVLLPEVVYNPSLPFLTLEGQYIIKNIVLISAAMVIGSHVRD